MSTKKLSLLLLTYVSTSIIGIKILLGKWSVAHKAAIIKSPELYLYWTVLVVG